MFRKGEYNAILKRARPMEEMCWISVSTMSKRDRNFRRWQVIESLWLVALSGARSHTHIDSPTHRLPDSCDVCGEIQV